MNNIAVKTTKNLLGSVFKRTQRRKQVNNRPCEIGWESAEPIRHNHMMVSMWSLWEEALPLTEEGGKVEKEIDERGEVLYGI